MLTSRYRSGVLSVLFGLALSACAPISPQPPEEFTRPVRPPPPAHTLASWPLQDLPALTGPLLELRSATTTVALLPTPVLKALIGAGERITAAANREGPSVKPAFHLIEGSAANAFAIVTADQPVIAINFAMFSLVGDDEAMWAALLGHEIAHLQRAHQQQRTERSEFNETASGLLSVVLSFAGLPFAPLFADGAAAMVSLGYSRDDELEADALSVSYLRAAGYDPAAALRFHERLAARSGDSSGGLLSTHPGGATRVEAIRRQLAADAAR